MVDPVTMFTELPYVAADTETTGFYPDKGDRICEVAFVKFHRGKVVDHLTRIVNPGVPIPEEITKVNGITNEMVREAKSFAEILPEIIEFIRLKPLVFHNAPFDLGFLRSEAVIAGTTWPKMHVVDTLDMARQSGLFPDNKLTTICKTLGIDVRHHRAQDDAYATGKILLHLLSNPRVRVRAVA